MVSSATMGHVLNKGFARQHNNRAYNDTVSFQRQQKENSSALKMSELETLLALQENEQLQAELEAENMSDRFDREDLELDLNNIDEFVSANNYKDGDGNEQGRNKRRRRRHLEALKKARKANEINETEDSLSSLYNDESNFDPSLLELDGSETEDEDLNDLFNNWNTIRTKKKTLRKPPPISEDKPYYRRAEFDPSKDSDTGATRNVELWKADPTITTSLAYSFSGWNHVNNLVESVLIKYQNPTLEKAA